MFHPSQLERRLRAILDPARRRNALGRRVSAASTLVACALMILLATLTSSVVRAVPHPPVEIPQPSEIDVRPNERITAPVVPIGLPADYRFRLTDSRRPALGQVPDMPPPPIFQLIPNWDGGRQADLLIPNHRSGTADTLFVERLKAQQLAQALIAR